MIGCSLSVYDHSRCYLFALGRNAMFAACQAVGLKEGDEVLSPAFDGDGTLQPFTAFGCRIVFYRSDPNTFAADVNDIRQKISERTRLIHVIHHFGMPQPWRELESLRRERGIPTLEDNAYSLFSSIEGQPFGTFGDLAIFSLRKELPLVDGGMLRINNLKFSWSRPARRVRWFYPTERGTLLSQVQDELRRQFLVPIPAVRLARLIGFLPDQKPQALPPLFSDPEAPYPVWPDRDKIGEEFSCDYIRPISLLGRKQLCRWSRGDFERLSVRRIMAYRTLVPLLQNVPGLTVLNPELPDGIVPFCLNLRLEKRRDEVLIALQKSYNVMAWPTLPGTVLEQVENFPEVRQLGRKLLQFIFPKGLNWPLAYDGILKQFAVDLKRIWERESPCEGKTGKN